jgi:Ca2+-binding RTX toxin-like protein
VVRGSPRATVTGGEGNDTIGVGHGSTTDAGAGDDKVLGGGDTDFIDGGPGNDKLYARPAGRRGGRRILDGGSGRDMLAVFFTPALYRARDGERDKIYCERRQTALIDRLDRIVGRGRSLCRRKRR